MAEIPRVQSTPHFITLGPEGTCHEEATRVHIARQGLTSMATVELVPRLFDDEDVLLGALGRVRDDANSFLVQCSAHTSVREATERYSKEVFVVDTFMYPNKGLGLLVRRDVADPRRLAVVSAARGYIKDVEGDWEVTEEASNPDVASKLLEGSEYDAGVTFVDLAMGYPDLLRVEDDWGKVNTTWLVYGNRQREGSDDWIGLCDSSVYTVD